MSRRLHFPDSCPVFKILFYFLAGNSFLKGLFYEIDFENVDEN